MSFVNPLYFLGLLAAGIPIVLHLIKRERAKKIEFPTLMFLRRISRKSIRYQKLRHLLLLLLRILALVCITLAFLRPYRVLPGVPTTAGRVNVTHIILLDNSMSMGYGDRWDRARKAAADIAAGILPGDRLAFLEFSDQTLVRTQTTDDASLVADEIRSAVRLTDRPTRYAQALKIAEKVALDSGAGRRVIHLVSDFQKSGWAAEEQEFRLGPGVELERTDVGGDEYSNLTIGDVHVSEAGEGGEGSLRIKYSLLNLGTQDRKGVKVSLLLDGRAAMERRTDTAKGEVQAGEFLLPGLTAGAHQVVLEVEDRQLSRDNRYSLMLQSRGRTQVFSVDDPGAGGTSSYFLARALNISSVSRYQLTSIPPGRVESSGSLTGALVIWNNAPGGGPGLQQELQDFVRRGGGLIVVVADGNRGADFNATFGSWLPIKIDRGGEEGRGAARRRGEEYSLLTDLRMDHQIFRPFGEPHSGSFSSARFYRHARLTLLEGAEALARFDNGDPALAAVNLDKGHILVLASSADDSANDLPLKAVYAPFWQQMLRFLDNVSEDSQSVEVGSTVSPRKYLLEASLRGGKGNLDLDQAMVVLDPEKARVTIPPGGDAVTVETVGFYEVRSPGQNAVIAVNPVPRESDLTHGNAEEMVAGWISHDANPAPALSEDERLSPSDQDKRQRFWRYLLLAAFVLLLGEALLSNRFVLRPE